MDLVVDANILFSALIKDGATRSLCSTLNLRDCRLPGPRS